jgi:hypothetical protein
MQPRRENLTLRGLGLLDGARKPAGHGPKSLSRFRQNATAIRIAIGEASEYASRILGRGGGGLATGGHVVNSGSARLHGADNFLLPQ